MWQQAEYPRNANFEFAATLCGSRVAASLLLAFFYISLIRLLTHQNLQCVTRDAVICCPLMRTVTTSSGVVYPGAGKSTILSIVGVGLRDRSAIVKLATCLPFYWQHQLQ